MITLTVVHQDCHWTESEMPQNPYCEEITMNHSVSVIECYPFGKLYCRINDCYFPMHLCGFDVLLLGWLDKMEGNMNCKIEHDCTFTC